MTQSPRISDTPRVGHYLLRLVRGGPWVAAEITHGPDGWTCMIDGKVEGPDPDPWALPSIERVHWGGRETTAEEVQFRIGVKRWAEIYAPNHAAANPTKAIDIDKLIPF